MTTTALVTGGAGFIGLRLARALAGKVDRVVLFDSLLPQVHGSESPSPPSGAVLIRGDVRDGSALADVLREHRPRLVYHLAAETGTHQSYQEPARYCDVNVGGTARLLEALRPLGRAVGRVVLASTRAVYGEGPYRTPDGAVIVPAARSREQLAAGCFEPVDGQGRRLVPLSATEDTPPAPVSVYGSSKLMQELLLRSGLEGTPIPVTILRLQNVYGPGQSLRNPYTGILSVFASRILRRERLGLFEDGGIVRDFVFVDDVVDALVAAGERDLPSGAVINVGSGVPTTILDAARILLHRLDGPADAYQVTAEFREGDVRYAVADIAKARTLLGWSPRTALEDGLQRLAAWARESVARGLSL